MTLLALILAASPAPQAFAELPALDAMSAQSECAELALESIQRVVQVMGTTLRVELEAPTRMEALAASELAIAAVERLESSLSTWRPTTPLSSLARAPLGEWIELTPEVGTILARAFEWESQTAGAFDPTLAPLVRVWDLRGAGRFPSEAERERALDACGVRHFSLELPRRISRSNTSAALEEGGFGKGAALDAAFAAIAETNVMRATFDLGGQMLFFTQDAATQVTPPLAIAHPDERDMPVLLLQVASGSCASSGNSERGLQVQGERIGHLLDPRTGLPADDFGSVTVWCSNALDADCLSTALYVLGPEKGLAFAESHAGVEAVFLVRAENGLRIRATSGLRPSLSPIDSELTVDWYLSPAPRGAQTK